MDAQLLALEITNERMQTNLDSSRKQSVNKGKYDFDSILKDTQMSKNKDALPTKPTIQKNNELKKNSIVGNKKDQVEHTNSKSINEDENLPKEDEMIEAIEEKTGFSEEEIKKVLNELGMTVYDLFLPQNLQQFIQRITNVEDPIDLLTIPNVNQVYKNIKDTLHQFKEQYPVLQNVVEQNEFMHKADTENVEPNQSYSSDELKIGKVDSHNTFLQNDMIIGKDNNNQPNEGFGQEQSGNHSSHKDTPIIEIEQDRDMTFDRSSNIEQSNDLALEDEVVDSFEDITFNDQGVMIQRSFKFESPTVNMASNQINSNQLDPEQLINQMVEHIKVNISEESAEMHLRLKPDHLGNLSLKIITERGIITAQFIAESQSVKEIIEANFNQLKNVLQEQGLTIENLEVYVKQDSKEQASNYMQNNSSKSSKRISEIITNLSEEPIEIYEEEYRSPYRRSESEIDFSA